jgi:Zn-dependent oligopeptidase
MISRRLLLSGFATLALTSQSHAGFFGFKTKAERDAEAAADAADLKALKKSLRLARKNGKKLPAGELARLDALKRKESERLALAGDAPVKKDTVKIQRVSRQELARIRAEDDAAAMKAKLDRKSVKIKTIEKPEVKVADCPRARSRTKSARRPIRSMPSSSRRKWLMPATR